MKFELFEHNRTAYASAVEMMETVGKAAIIHPTGTGKSFIGFQLAADHQQEQILWLSPSRYIFETQIENLKAAAGMKSDGDIPEDCASEGDLPEECVSERALTEGSVSDEEFLNNIEFLTYAKLMLMEADEIAELHPAYIILDEFHCCGAQMWGQGVKRLLDTYPDVPILGLSATNIRYLDNQRDMAQELFDGNIASEITLGEAIVRGILNPPKYVLSIFKYQDELLKYEARVRGARSKVVRDEGEKYLEALRRALENADGLDVIFDKHMTNRTGKYIVFCANKEHMDEMMGHLEWFGKVDQHPHVYSLYTSEPSTSKEFDDFKADNDNTHLRLLYCIDALNQGIHVPDISGVILLRPTVSPIIYKQQIGRALSAVSQKQEPKQGNLSDQQNMPECPVIFDIVMNIENLYSIGAIEEEMEIATAYYRSLGESEYVVNEHFKVIDEVKDCVELFNRLNDVLTASWDLMYEKARDYYEENGDLNVPHRYVTADGYSIGSWVSTQRAVRAGTMNAHLTQEQIDKLSSIGMIWESRRELAWTKNYNAAKAYYDEHGVLDAPVDYVTEDGVALGTWLMNIRKWKNSGIHQKYLTPERIDQLSALGMAWGLHDYYWEQMYQKATEYYQAHGNLKVPNKYITEDGMRLGAWVHRQRNLGKGRRTGKAAQVLAEKQQGAKDNPCKGKRSPAEKIAGDVSTTQNIAGEDTHDARENSRKKESGLSPERIRRLNAIGMIWTEGNEANWDKNYELAKQYYEAHGNLSMPKKYKVGDQNLGYWVSRQKASYNAGKLSEKRRERMEAIGVRAESRRTVA